MYSLLVRNPQPSGCRFSEGPGIEKYCNILSGMISNNMTVCYYAHINDIIIPPGNIPLIVVQPWLPRQNINEIISDIRTRPNIPVVLDYLAEHAVYDTDLLIEIQCASNKDVIILLGDSEPSDPGAFYIFAQACMHSNTYTMGLPHTKIKCFSGKPNPARTALTHELSKVLSAVDFTYSNNPAGWRGLDHADEQYLIDSWGYTRAETDEIIKFGKTRVILDSDSDYRISRLYPTSLQCDFAVYSETLSSGLIFVTEKTYKCFFTSTPFLVLAPAGFLGHLRSIGFKTFNGIIDETYDTIQNHGERLRAIVAETVRLVESPNYKHKVEQCRTICEHNFNQMNNPTILRQFSNNLLENIYDSLNK